MDYDQYSEQVKKLLDKHVVGVEVKEPTGVYDVSKMGKTVITNDWSEEKTRNETDIIKTRVTRMIEQDLRDDPYAQEAFSKLLRQAIAEAEQQFDHPMKQYLLFSDFEQQVRDRRLDDIPELCGETNMLKPILAYSKPAQCVSQSAPDLQADWVQRADIDQAVIDSVHEHSINPQNIEADIRKKLLPQMFCLE